MRYNKMGFNPLFVLDFLRIFTIDNEDRLFNLGYNYY